MKLATVVLLMALPALATAQVYRWTDAKGKVHYSDQPPPAGAKQATEKNIKGSAAERPAAQPQIAVVLYSTATCGQPCEQAKSHLAKRNIAYSKKDPATDVSANEALRANGGTPRVPTLMLGNEKLEGYNETAWDAAFNLAGFAKPQADNKP